VAHESGPIGMFDSGVGGLAVLAEVRRLLPYEDIVYYADTAHFPYGDRGTAEIQGRSEAITRELLALGAKLIVVACNTATSAAIARLRTIFDAPFVGMEPALKPAAEKTLSGKVALLATPGTARGEKLAALIDRYGAEVSVETIEAPVLAACVEAGTLESVGTGELIRQYLAPIRRSGADVVVLGCTHYAFLRNLIERELGEGVLVIEPSAAVAAQVARMLDSTGLRNPSASTGRVRYLCSGDEGTFTTMRDELLESLTEPEPGAPAPELRR